MKFTKCVNLLTVDRGGGSVFMALCDVGLKTCYYFLDTELCVMFPELIPPLYSLHTQ